MTTPKPDAATPRPYYAKDGVVLARPTTTPNSDGSVSMTMGFCVCEICSHVTDNAAEEIATALNNAALVDELADALRDISALRQLTPLHVLRPGEQPNAAQVALTSADKIARTVLAKLDKQS